MSLSMRNEILEFYAKVSDLISEEEFEKRVVKYSREFDGLISMEVLAHLIIDELGRNVKAFSSISNLKSGVRASLFVIVTKPQPKVFTKQKGSPKAADVRVSDPSGLARLLLWDPHHVELIESSEIKIGTKLKLINAKVAESAYGLDLSIDKYDSLVIEPTDFPMSDNDDVEIQINDIKDISEDGPVNIIGTISKKGYLRTFNRKDNSKGYVINLELYDGTGAIRFTLWDEHAKSAESFSIGEQIKVINGYSKIHNSQREIQTSYRTEIMKIN
jgi:ssDNA-binding replication factor A large subunit